MSEDQRFEVVLCSEARRRLEALADHWGVTSSAFMSAVADRIAELVEVYPTDRPNHTIWPRGLPMPAQLLPLFGATSEGLLRGHVQKEDEMCLEGFFEMYGQGVEDYDEPENNRPPGPWDPESTFFPHDIGAPNGAPGMVSPSGPPFKGEDGVVVVLPDNGRDPTPSDNGERLVVIVDPDGKATKPRTGSRDGD